MGAWTQSILGGLGNVGESYGKAVDYNAQLALETINKQLLNQEIQSRIKEQDYRLKQQQTPKWQFFGTPQGGTVGVPVSPEGTIGAKQTIVSDPSVPGSLSDSEIDSIAETLPPQYNKSAFKDSVRGLRDMGYYREALTQIGTASRIGLKMDKVVKPDPSSETGWSLITYDKETGEEISRQRDVAPSRGLQERETVSTDPFGVTTTTISKPIIRGGTTAAEPSRTTAPKSVTPSNVTPSATAVPKAGGTVAAVRGKLPLDADFHIPAADAKKVNPYLLQAANQLIDGMSIKDLQLPEKDKQAAANVAARYGWQQGKFTPREWLLVRESKTILDQAYNSDALKALDENWLSKQKLIEVLVDQKTRGMIGRRVESLATAGLNPRQQEFARLYNQMVGRISGLSQLVRSGRATEAQIERLKMELPNPLSTVDSKDAKRRIKYIMDEVRIAEQKGTFEASQADSSQLSPEAQKYMREHGLGGSNAPTQ